MADSIYDKPEIYELPNFKYTQQGFKKLKTALKEGKIVRNPFAKFYTERIEVSVIKYSVTEPNDMAI